MRSSDARLAAHAMALTLGDVHRAAEEEARESRDAARDTMDVARSAAAAVRGEAADASRAVLDGLRLGRSL